MNKLLRLCAAFSFLVVVTGIAAQGHDEPEKISVELKPVREGSLSRLNRPELRSVSLSSKKPDGLKQGLDDDSAVYGTLPLGMSEHGMFVAITESTDSKTSTLVLDANGDGDLTNDVAVDSWKAGPAAFGAVATVRVGEIDVNLRLFRYTTKLAQTSRSLKDNNPLFFSREDVREGKLILGDKSYYVLLKDLAATGRYDKVTHAGDAPAVGIYVDRNHDGEYDRDTELCDLALPFAIDKRILELDTITADGSRLNLKLSARHAPEVPEGKPAKLAVGQPAPTFKADLLDDKQVAFPGDFKGKVVLLTFWSTGCGPCRSVIADEVRTYERFKDSGFEVLGVNLDDKKRASQVHSFRDDWGMTWPEVLDGSEGSVARLYNVQSIPRAVLVDGSTGKILATPEHLKRDGVNETVRTVLSIREALQGK
jgi:peroxiredoxin